MLTFKLLNDFQVAKLNTREIFFKAAIAKIVTLQQKNTGLIDISERVVLLSRHEVDIKEDRTL